MSKDIKQIRKTLHLLKPKTFYDFEENKETGLIKNLDDILGEYKKIARVAKDLVPLPDKTFQDALTTQANEFLFFKSCAGNLKGMLDYHEALIKYRRGKKYNEIRKSESREHNHTAINSIVDSDRDILDITFDMLKVKEMYDRYNGIVESYTQRGYSLNNITKGLELMFMDTIL